MKLEVRARVFDSPLQFLLFYKALSLNKDVRASTTGDSGDLTDGREQEESVG